MLLALAAVIAAGCGPGETSRPTQGGRVLSAYGVTVTLPRGWTGRILLGAENRPVLHAANFDLSSTDTDAGMIAREIGGEMYVNVRDLGPGDGDDVLLVDLSASDFKREGLRLLEASRDIVEAGTRWRVTVVSGRTPPVERALGEANQLLGTMSLEPYAPVSPQPLPKDARRIEGYGMSIALPPGWAGRITRGRLETAAPSDGIHLRLLEHGGTDAPFERRQLPIRLSVAEFIRDTTMAEVQAVSGRSFVDHGREFALWVSADTLPPDANLVEQANQALASLRVEPGDFYPGTVEPAAFAPAAGWHTGDGGPEEAQPGGQQTWTWASTSPYRDESLQSPPYKTLEHLPPDGIVITLWLFGPDLMRGNSVEQPFRIADAGRSAAWQGQVRDLPLYTIHGRVPDQRYGINIAVYFGRARPTEAQVEAADAELSRLRLPDWSATD